MGDGGGRRDEPDRALVSFYGMLAAGFTRDTFTCGEGCALESVDDWGRQFYCPPNSAGNAHFPAHSGDTFPLGPDNFGPKVAILEPGRAMVLHGDSRSDEHPAVPMKPGEYIAVLWTFYLEPIDGKTTRLIERFRMDYTPTGQNTVFYRAFLEPGSFIMERKMLLGIKQRAEAVAVVPVLG